MEYLKENLLIGSDLKKKKNAINLNFLDYLYYLNSFQ